jgi:hypothetical protein
VQNFSRKQAKIQVPQLPSNPKIVAVQGNFLQVMSSIRHITKGEKNAYKNFGFCSIGFCPRAERLRSDHH